MPGHYILLGLHGKLLRHDQKILLLWMFHGKADHFVVQICSFSGTGTAQNQLQCHMLFPFLYLNSVLNTYLSV